MRVHLEHGNSLTDSSKGTGHTILEPEQVSTLANFLNNEAQGLKRGRKRKRVISYDDPGNEDGSGTATPMKRLKRTLSDIGKDWACQEMGCDKMFKTVS